LLLEFGSMYCEGAPDVEVSEDVEEAPHFEARRRHRCPTGQMRYGLIRPGNGNATHQVEDPAGGGH
jgi:hypothetical protein